MLATELDLEFVESEIAAVFKLVRALPLAERQKTLLGIARAAMPGWESERRDYERTVVRLRGEIREREHA